MKRCIAFALLIMVVLVTAAPLSANSQSRHKIKIAAFNFYPTLFQDKDGSVKGFYVDFLSEIAKRENWDIEYVYGNWADGLSKIKSGEVDVLTNVAFTAERSQFMDYGKIPLLTVWAELYVPAGSSGIENIRDVKGKKIALMKGDFNASNFKNLVEKFGIPCQYVEFGNFEEVFKAVASRQVDGGIANNTFGTAKQNEYNLRSSGVIFNPFDIFFTTSKGQNGAILATLDRYLEEWRKSEASPYHQARERWSHGSAATIRVVHPWMKKTALGLVLLLGIAIVFVYSLRIQVRRKTSEIRAQSEELHLLTRQLEEELAERQIAQESLEEQAARLEEEITERLAVQESLEEKSAILEEEIQERLHIQEELEHRDEQYRLLFENMTTGFALHEMIYDDNGNPIDYRFLEINPAFEKLTGATAASFVGRTVREVMPGTESYWIEKYGKVAMSGKSAYFEEYSKELNRHFECWVFSPSKDRFAVIFSDATERKQLYEQLNRAQKMDTVGRLAGGVAHDFNNKLSVILGYAELAKMRKCSIGKECNDYIEEIIQAGQHAQEITRRLLTFSRSESANPIKLDVNLVLTDVRKTLGRMIGEHAELHLDLQQDINPVRIDPTQFDQVITNLVVNARDAMPKGGDITLATVNVTIDDDTSEVPNGDYVMISCSDTGSGMEAHVLEHIFEPFFTTKEVGKGTGLGLSSVYGIVRQNNGYITVHSEPGKGAMFSIFLPCLATSTPLKALAASSLPERPTQGTILLVEDEEPVRRITKLMLENFGYAVIAAENQQHAIKICVDGEEKIHCVLTDIVMPGMNGKELHDHIKAIRLELPFVFMSGYAEQNISDQMSLDGFEEIIQKPINFQLLNKKLISIITSG